MIKPDLLRDPSSNNDHTSTNNNSIYLNLNYSDKKLTLNQVKNRLLILSPSVHEGLERECNKDDFEAIEDKALGKGGFGHVWKVRHKLTGKIYAIKVINKDYIKKEKMIDQINREIEIMYRTDHPHIIKLYNHYEDDENFYLIMHCAGKGQLYHLLKRSKRLDEKTVAQYIREVISAVKYLHSMKPPIIHRDIKPENVLLDSDGRAKLADFGWSNFYDENKQRETYCGTPEYLAPEMVNKSGHNESIDIWSLGVLMFELLAGRPPFIYKGDTNELYNDIKNLRIKWTDDFPTLAKNLIIKILKLNPAERLSLDGIIDHPWFKQHNPLREILDPGKYDPAAKFRSHLINVLPDEEEKIVSEVKSLLQQRRESLEKNVAGFAKTENRDVEFILETEVRIKKQEIVMLKEEISKRDQLIEQLKIKIEKISNEENALRIRDRERDSFLKEIESKTKRLLEVEANLNLTKNENDHLQKQYSSLKDRYDEITMKNLQLEKLTNELNIKLNKLDQEKQQEIMSLEKKLRIAEVVYVQNDSNSRISESNSCDADKITHMTREYVAELVELIKVKFMRIEEKLLTSEKTEVTFREEMMSNLDKRINEIVNYFKECYDRLIVEERNLLSKRIEDASSKNVNFNQSLEWYKQQTAELSQYKKKFNQDKNELIKLKNENSTLIKSREVLIEKNNYLESFISTQNDVLSNLRVAKENYKNAFLESEKLFQKYVADKNLRQLINFKYNIVEC